MNKNKQGLDDLIHDFCGRPRRKRFRRWVKSIFRAFPLMRYKASQHDLICDATKAGKDYLDDGCTAYESVCVLMMKLEMARDYVERQPDEEASELLDFLNADQDGDDFCMMPLYGTEGK